MIQHTFDTLTFANKLKAAGLDPKIAETQAALQGELQNNITEKLSRQQTTLDKLTKHDWATKEDITKIENKLENKINMVENRLENKINMVESKLAAKITLIENRLFVKLSGTMVGCSAILGALATFFHISH